MMIRSFWAACLCIPEFLHIVWIDCDLCLYRVEECVWIDIGIDGLADCFGTRRIRCSS